MNHFFVAGFDFGTSYSKVVLRDQLTKLGKAVTFGSEGEGLFPSFVWCDGKRVGSPLGQPFGERVPYLKLMAADSTTGRQEYQALYETSLKALPGANLLLTAFFASAISEILVFIANDSEWDDFDRRQDILVIQLAVPTGMMDGRNSSLEQLMKDALKAAYLLVEQGLPSAPISLQILRTVWDEVSKPNSPEGIRLDQLCGIYPEVAAGVQTILRSRSSPDGKYITMDVGAGTVDLNAFYYMSGRTGATRRLNYWSCKVVPLGCSRLPILHEDAGSHERTSGTLTKYQVQRELGKAITTLMNKAFTYQPRIIVGDGGDPWSRSTHCYVFGGGARNWLYPESLRDKLSELKIGVPALYWLPQPSEGFELPGDVDQFGRFAVAYGLSFHSANLEEVRLPSELQTFREAYPDTWKTTAPPRYKPCICYSNPDCARCGGTGFLYM